MFLAIGGETEATQMKEKEKEKRDEVVKERAKGCH